MSEAPQRILMDTMDTLAEMSYGASIDILTATLGGSPTHSTSHGSSSSHYNESSHGSSHGSSHAGGHELFGSLESIDSAKWTVSLIIVVAAVLLIEGIFHLVHIFTEDSPFHKVISALEKELMIVGVTAFLFKIILNSIDGINDSWKFALEIADLIVPLFSFTNCFISLVLIFRSLHHCDIWSKAYHLKAAELLDEYVSSPALLTLRRWFPTASKLIEEIEFQFMHDAFCQQYSVQKKAFAFDEYANLVYERFIQHIIEFKLYHWFVMVALLMFYWIPNEIVEEVYSCHDSGEEHYCLHHGATTLLIIFGGGLLFVVVCFAASSRLYLRAILQRNGLRSIDDYPEFLQIMDQEVDAVQEKKRLGEDELKIVIQAALKDAAHAHKSHGQHHHKIAKNVSRWIGGCFDSIKDCFRPNKQSVSPTDSTYNEDELRDMINSSFKQVAKNASAKAADPKSAPAQIPEVFDTDCEQGEKPLEAAVSSPSGRSKVKHNSFKQSHSPHLKDIFLFHNPTLYFEGVQMLLLPLSLYFAVWFVEFSVYKEEAYFKIVSLLLGFISVFVFMYVVKSAALLKAMYHVDKDVMLEVIEQTEGSRILGETIREKLLHRLSNVNEDAYTTLRNLFDEIDKNRSNKLSRVEFEMLMDRLEVNFSRKKWKQIYHEIDRNYDDEISFDEFFIFLFPNHDFATANEMKRLKLVRSRVAQKQKDLLRSSIFGNGDKGGLTFDNLLEKGLSEGQLAVNIESGSGVPAEAEADADGKADV